MQNLISFFGIFVLIFVAWLLSEDRRRFPWRVVIWGLALQFAFGYLVLGWKTGSDFFGKLNEVFDALLRFGRDGATFVFNALGSSGSGETPISLKEYLTRLGAESKDPVVQTVVNAGAVPGFSFAFQVLPTIIFFSALLSVLYYMGVMQKIVLLFAKVMARTMNLSGAEALSNSANIFVGQTEAPLVVRPYIEKMTRSELMAIMVGGFSNTAGGVLGAYVMMLVGYFPNIASHLISASLLSAPAAFIITKVLVPEREEPLTKGEVKMDVPIEDSNVIDAAANGTTIGWQLAINVGAMLISFVALIALGNWAVSSLSGFFTSPQGMVRFDVLVLAVLGGLLVVEQRRPTDTHAWLLLVALGLVYVGASQLFEPPWPAAIGLTGVAFWLPVFLGSGRQTGYAKSVWITVLTVAVAANLVYLAFGPLPAEKRLSLQLLLGWVHWPAAFVMGVPAQDCLAIGQLLGEKLILTEFGAYQNLANLLGAAGRGEVPALDPRSVVIISYALCGFANLASIGIQIGGLAALAPSRRHDIARLGFKAMVGGALATFMIACVAGVFYAGRSMLDAR